MAFISDFVARLLRRAGEVIFSADDEFARNQDWQVEKGQFGLSRNYWHRGFDRLARCPQCSNRGPRGEAACSRCAGTGQITLDDRLPVLPWKAWRGYL